MTRIENKGTLDYEPIHIGKLIEEELRRQERTVTWLSRKIHCDRRNVYKIFARPYIDTDLLYRLSLVLNTDFFFYFSSNLHHINNQSLTPPLNKSKTHLPHRLNMAA